MPLLGGPTCPVRGATGGQGCRWRHDDSTHGPSAQSDHDDSRMTSYFTTPIPWYSVSVRHRGVWVPCDRCLGAQWAHSHTPCAPRTPWLTPYAPHWPYVVPMATHSASHGAYLWWHVGVGAPRGERPRPPWVPRHPHTPHDTHGGCAMSRAPGDHMVSRGSFALGVSLQ